MLTDSARCSRATRTAFDCSVGRMSNDTATTPSSKWWWTAYPASLKTLSMRRFCGRTSAVNCSTPSS